MSHFTSSTFTKRLKTIINPHNDSLGCLCSSAIGSSRFVNIQRVHLSEVTMAPSFQNPEKCCQLCQTCTPRDQNVPRFFDKHLQFCAPNETFLLVQSTQLSGKLCRLKNKHVRKNVQASRLNANGSNNENSNFHYLKLHLLYVGSFAICTVCTVNAFNYWRYMYYLRLIDTSTQTAELEQCLHL